MTQIGCVNRYLTIVQEVDRSHDHLEGQLTLLLSVAAVNKNFKSWDTCLALVEFAYNRSIHSSHRKTPFEVVYGFNPITPIDLAPLPANSRVCLDGKKRAEQIKALLEQVKKQIEKKNAAYAQGANKGRKQVHFNPGDLVWIHLRKERFPSKRKSKLMPRAEGPFLVKEKVNNDNAYKIELLDDYNVSATFNVKDLSPYFEDEEDTNLRANPSKPGGDDVPKNIVQDEARSSSGPITRSLAKKLAATLPGPFTLLKCFEIGDEESSPK
ncbi:hypothetical protein CRG98_010692 [Punica granatum]|uniref:Tf2-1-like SH3-like domain-containing protein n=1 Tax=Punica granatum TaxID=22663 RepID=A0A2I0KKC7_PUNGR|nr:hypothetical protein CRG98_010692 [Punica granatum]